MIPKHNALTINKYNTTAVSAASKAQIIITKITVPISKFMLFLEKRSKIKIIE